MKPRNIIFILLLCAATHLAWGQDIKKDMEQLQAAYSSAVKLHTEAEVSIYENLSDTKAQDRKKAVIKKDGNNYLYSLDNNLMLLNGKCLLMIYPTEKQIVYEKRSPNQEEQLTKSVIPDIDSLLRKTDSVRYRGSRDGMKHYSIYSSKSMIKQTDIFLDAASGGLKKISYLYNTQMLSGTAKVDVDYKLFDTAPVFGTDTFSEKNYIVRNGKQYKAAPKYYGYNVSVIDPDEL